MITLSTVVIDALHLYIELHLLQTHCALGPVLLEYLLYRKLPIWITGFPNRDVVKVGYSEIKTY